MNIETSVDPVAECSILIHFEAEPSHKLSLLIGEISHYLTNQLGAMIMNVTPSFDSILIDYLPHRVSIFEFVPYLEKLVTEAIKALPDDVESHHIELPIYYHDDVGPDLQDYYAKGLSLEEIIDLHTTHEYTVGAIGFAPGFAFLTSVADSLRLPRKPSPRVKLPKGSVGIANSNTAVYPAESPGGWNIIGNCPLDLYTPQNSPILPFSIGTKVRFRPISEKEFLRLGGEITKGWQ
ncbi:MULTISPECIES: 5-oxoprolinase subunit B family protein [Vibrio]|uniref:5-oxoprolinase subunit B family protein n=1 Tax=Vibrio TaxID=662 RepID=UPI002075EF01|nr:MULTISPECIES: carboxyltransferase domain-containing protein [Vibrio]USD34210.1 carboxyltransferase domain-containing protein [Vibrio sp. SCSIO 43186]USD47282.1 carboxyltransferase domain-containing protein [Vibrio sp. SCSIO 43145]USD71334.1 carboxyltransferase domain-containing protein [Vibrio sp. SCSIO 43139]USD98246.1 allophanate hydrolase [Vibrio coralliilyticus]